MENGKKMYVTGKEAAEMLGASTGYAYKIIWGLNEDGDVEIMINGMNGFVEEDIFENA